MSAVIFDGEARAREKEKELAIRVAKLEVRLRMASVVFEEDEASLLYARLKQEAAVRVGIEFSKAMVSMTQSIEEIQRLIEIYDERSDIAGVMVQKPRKRVWKEVTGAPKVGSGFGFWWRDVVRHLDPVKDVDCLTEMSLHRVYTGEWEVLPATVRGVIEALKVAMPERLSEYTKTGLGMTGLKVVVIGRSDIVGKPLTAVLAQSGGEVRNYGVDLDERELKVADVVVSATGLDGLVSGEMLKPGVVFVDVGSPMGDAQVKSVMEVASFVTPVPGGVGPMTVVSLLENLVERVEGVER